jgi:hypothetical protein
VDRERMSMVRDAVALVIVAVACPLAVLFQWLVGCSGQGINARCATDAVLISPALLVVAGVLAGIATRGWTGLLVAFVGGAIGMTSILLLAGAFGRSVPLDPISGVIATFWFMTPVTLGYGGCRLAWHVNEWRKGSGPGSQGPGGVSRS